MSSVAADGTARFAGGLLWLDRREIWSEDVDRVGYQFLGGMTSQQQGAVQGEIAPGYTFNPHEFDLAHAAVAVPLLFQWDAYFVPTDGAFVAFISHDGYLELRPRDPAVRARLQTRLEALGLLPVAESARSSSLP